MSDRQGLHKPVLLAEVLAYLNIQEDGIYIDATFGRGGHSREILRRLSANGRLLVIDQDKQAIEAAQAMFAEDARVSICHGNFSQLEQIAGQQGVAGKVKGILLDLGVSSPQLDQAQRGFSFMQDGPLDMRMDQTTGMTAAQWLNEATEKELSDVFWRYGEERQARRIAAKIVAVRQQQPLSRTGQLAQLVAALMPNKHKMKKHPATRVFQAVRIFINRELDHIEQALLQAKSILAPGGRLAVISFHSLEDRLVKQAFQRFCAAEQAPRHLPITGRAEGEMKQIKKKIKASRAELEQNPRSRSAILRVVEKC